MTESYAYERLGAAIVEQACRDFRQYPGDVRRFFCDKSSIFDLCMPTADGKSIYDQLERNYSEKGSCYSAE